MDGFTCLLACLLLPQTPDLEEPPPLTPRWSVGQELVYRGSIHETSLGQGVQFAKQYRLEARAFVLDLPRPGVVQLACFTRLNLAAADKDKADAVSVRLEVGLLNEVGQVSPRQTRRPYGDFEGPDSLEDGYLVELPRGAVRTLSSWKLETPGEPPRFLRLAGVENQNGAPCLKLIQTQQAEEWDRPRGDRSAWKIETQLWIQPRTGFVQKVQRTLIGRPAAHREPTYRMTAIYELESQLRYEGPFLEDRKREIEQHRQLQAHLRGLSSPGARTVGSAFDVVLDRLDRFLNQQAATPYRDSLVRLREQTVAAKQRQLPVPLAQAGEAPAKGRLAVGQPAPDFAVRSLDGKDGAGLRTWRGRAVLFVFFQPGAASAPALLPGVQQLHASLPADSKVVVVGLALSDDEDEVRRVRQRFNLTFPIFAGKSLRQSYEAATTPHFVLVDEAGLVAGQQTGWGPESAAALAAELKRLGEAK